MKTGHWHIAILLLSLPFFAAGERYEREIYRVTRCLGQEEIGLHKNHSHDYRFFLNQQLMSEFLQVQGFTLKDSFYAQIKNRCLAAPSHTLFYILLKHGRNAFRKAKGAKEGKNQKKKYLINLENRLPALLSSYIKNIEKYAPSPNCLEKVIPELKELNVQRLYTDSSFNLLAYLNKKRRLERIFEKLKDVQELYQKCTKL